MACNIPSQNFSLSFGALRRILNGESLENVVLQILGYKQIPGKNSNRFRLLLNDGIILFPYAILATQLNNLLYEKNLEKFSIFKLKNYACSELLGDKKVIICIDVEVLFPGIEVKEKISFKDNSCNYNIHGEHVNDISNSLTVVPNLNSTFSCGYTNTLDRIQNWDTVQNRPTLSPSTSSTVKHFSSISSLNPYFNKWTIKARVVYITPIESYSNSYKQGKYFSFYLLDDSGEIRATSFNENVDHNFELLELNKIYIISNAVIRPPKENSSVKYDYEMIIERNTKIEPYSGDDTSVPNITYDFHTIKEIESLPIGSYTDIIGICDHASDITVTKLKSNNKELAKRNLFLIDKSDSCIMLTLWGSNAENYTITDNLVIAVKNARLTHFRGCSLNTTSASWIFIDPNIKEAIELKSWFQKLNSVNVTQICANDISHHKASQNWKTVAEVYNESYNGKETPMYYVLKATIISVKKDKCMYRACPLSSCLKKVEPNNGMYRCNKCNEDYTTFNWTLLLHLELADFSGTMSAVVFKDVAENLIGISSIELSKIKDEDEDKYYDILSALDLKSYIFKMRSNVEVYNGDSRLKSAVLNFDRVEAIFYTEKLMVDINRLSKILNRC